MSETENQIRLRKAKEYILICQSNEANARNALMLAINSTKRAREKYHDLFVEEENRQRSLKIKEQIN